MIGFLIHNSGAQFRGDQFGGDSMPKLIPVAIADVTAESARSYFAKDVGQLWRDAFD